MANAYLAREWLGAHAPGQMAAVSTNVAACGAFGIPEARVFGFWDWVGGRYSLWSAIGLSLAIGIGAAGFRALLAGAAEMDRHFRHAPMAENLPVLMALVGLWRRNAMGWPTLAIVPYDQRLARFGAYLQQLEMESNGKRTRLDGTPAAHATAPVIWGAPGTDAQHSFFQLLHQGTDVVPVDIIAAATPRGADAEMHRMLLANALAQTQALAIGKTEEEVRAEMAAAGAPAAEIDRLAPHLPRRPAVDDDPVPPARPGQPRPADRALRAQGVRAGDDLGDQPVRPMGGRAWQVAGQGADPGARRRGGAGRRRLDARAGRPDSRPDGGGRRLTAEADGA